MGTLFMFKARLLVSRIPSLGLVSSAAMASAQESSVFSGPSASSWWPLPL